MSRKLHIGGKVSKEGWEVLNALPGPNVDHVCNANDLSQFEDNTFEAIYASHIVEHLDYNKELVKTLTEWNRVIKPKGKIYISVPDMDTLAQLFVMRDKLNDTERFQVMTILFGGHMDEYDYHAVGLNMEFLGNYLYKTGFRNIQRVKNFDLFEDTSSMLFKDVPISLNVIAEKIEASE